MCYFSGPQLLWLIVSLIRKCSKKTIHVGFIAQTVSFIIVAILIYSADNYWGAFGSVFLYYPIVLFIMPIFLCAGRSIKTFATEKADSINEQE